MRLAVPVLAIALLSAAPQEKAKPCDLSKVEDGLYCAKCKKILVKTEKASDFDKDGNCKECKSAPEKVRVCVKEWIPRCGMHDNQPHAEPCCKSKFCCKHETVYGLVLWTCTGCKGTGPSEDKVKHGEEKHEQKVEKSCSQSGTFPHGGELPKK